MQEGAFLVYSVSKLQTLLLRVARACPAWIVRERKRSRSELGRTLCSQVCGEGAHVLGLRLQPPAQLYEA